jgi:hypothetical protein
MANKFFEWLSGTILRIHNGSVEIADIDFNNGILDIHPTTLSLNGVTLSKTATQLNSVVAGVAAGYKIARGQRTMLSATDTVATGLTTVVVCGAVMESDPVLTFDRITSQIGDQAGAPVAGSIILKGWMPTGAALSTPIAATGYANIKINWWAIGV